MMVMFYQSKLLLILFLSCSIVPSHSMVSLCQNVTIVATEFRLGRTRSDSADCNCRLVSTNNKTNNVKVNNSALDGCQYRFLVDYEGKHSYYSCVTKQSWTTTVTMDTEVFNFKLEPFKPTNDGAEFTLNITSTSVSVDLDLSDIDNCRNKNEEHRSSNIYRPSSDANLTLTCFVPTLTTSTQLPSSTTQPSRTKTTNGSLVTETALRETEDSVCSVMHKVSLSGIGVGSFTAGFILGVLCLLGITWCRRSRNEEENNYSSTYRNEEDLHTYSEAGDAKNIQSRTKVAYIVPQESVYENLSK